MNLERLGWYAVDRDSLKSVPTTEGKVGIANTPARGDFTDFFSGILEKTAGGFSPLDSDLPTVMVR